MIKIEININNFLFVAYAIGMALFVILMGYAMIPLIYWKYGIIYAVGSIVILVFAYLAYLAGLAKELRFRGGVH